MINTQCWFDNMKDKYQLTQGYRFYEGHIVLMYFIQGMPYTFDDLNQLIQDHPSVQTEALEHRDFDDTDLYKTSSYLVSEEVHPLMFELHVDNPELLPKDD